MGDPLPVPHCSADPLMVRAGVPGDEAFVYASWLNAMWNTYTGFLPAHLWYPAHREAIRAVLESPSVRILVLCDLAMPDSIIAFLVRDPTYLHWVHVRGGKWRNRGMARRLLLAAKVSRETPAAWMSKLGRAKLPNPLRSLPARLDWWAPAPQSGS